MLPRPIWPLAGHARLGQYTVVGSITILLAWLCWGACQEEVCLDPRCLCNLTPPRFSVELPPHTTPKPQATQKGLPRSRWLRQLGVTDQLVEWVKPVRPPVHPPEWLTPELFASFPAVLGVRELRYRVAQAGFRTQTVTLVTTLLEVDLYPADALAELYHMRWQVETNLRHLKQTMGLDVLHCQRLVGVLKELTVFALVYNLVRVVMLAAAQRQGVALER